MPTFASAQADVINARAARDSEEKNFIILREKILLIEDEIQKLAGQGIFEDSSDCNTQSSILTTLENYITAYSQEDLTNESQLSTYFNTNLGINIEGDILVEILRRNKLLFDAIEFTGDSSSTSAKISSCS